MNHQGFNFRHDRTLFFEVIKDFKLPINELGYFVTRIEEEHLWEAKQLGMISHKMSIITVFGLKYFKEKISTVFDIDSCL